MIWQIKKIGSHCTHIFSCRKILFYEEKEKKRTDEIQEVNRSLIWKYFYHENLERCIKSCHL